ncbi:hypothetical protein RB594_006673 [Gaeumannomyces avenae]
MSSSTARPFPDGNKRANGAADRAGPQRPRVSANDSFRSDRDPRYREASPQPGLQPGFSSTNTSHKRSASGNLRPSSRTVEERRTEKTHVTTRETIVSRTRSPNRRAQPPPQDKPKTSDMGGKHRAAADSRPREPRSEPPQAVWEPEATLLPHTTAPLASRISIPPLTSQQPAPLQPLPLHDIPLAAQEALILEDLLFVLMGIEGQYIRYAKIYNPEEERDRLAGPTFRILPGLDPSLQDLTASMLGLATHYSSLMAFVDVQSRDEFGSVNHALCASIRKLLQDYLVLIAQLETQFLTDDAFTLHVLNIHLLPTSHMMLQLHDLAHELLKKNALLDEESDDSADDDDTDFDNIVNRLREGGDIMPGNMAAKKISKGGAVLAIITARLESMSGDPAAREVLTTLLRDASRPYMAMLNEWLHHGAINDPHSEFLVKQQKSIRRERLEQDYTDDYWEKRYTIREQDVPVPPQLSLMNLLLTAHSLPARLRSMKHYFFLDPSDYFIHFLELGAAELKRPVKAVNTSKLQSLLDLVLRQPGTVVSLDPFKEDVKVEMNEVPLVKSLQRVVNITGIEAGEALQPLTNLPNEADRNAVGFNCLQLDYAVPFPVSLVISRRTVWRYQALFRYLLSLRHLESLLSNHWQTHNQWALWTRKSPSRRIEAFKRRVLTLRARMLVFVQQLLYFCTAEVIEPNWHKFMQRLEKKEGAKGLTRTVDELMQDHVDFLDTCLKECMLTNSKLLKINAKLMHTVLFFATYSRWFNQELKKADPELNGTVKPAGMSDRDWAQIQALPTDKSSSAGAGGGAGGEKPRDMYEILAKWEVNFSRHLHIMLDSLNHYAATETVVLLSLCARLSAASEGTETPGQRAMDEEND